MNRSLIAFTGAASLVALAAGVLAESPSYSKTYEKYVQPDGTITYRGTTERSSPSSALSASPAATSPASSTRSISTRTPSNTTGEPGNFRMAPS